MYELPLKNLDITHAAEKIKLCRKNCMHTPPPPPKKIKIKILGDGIGILSRNLGFSDIDNHIKTVIINLHF